MNMIYKNSPNPWANDVIIECPSHDQTIWKLDQKLSERSIFRWLRYKAIILIMLTWASAVWLKFGLIRILLDEPPSDLDWLFEDIALLKKDLTKLIKWNVKPLIWAFGGQQYIVAHCGSPSPLPAWFLSVFLIILHPIWFSLPVWLDDWQHEVQPRAG